MTFEDMMLPITSVFTWMRHALVRFGDFASFTFFDWFMWLTFANLAFFVLFHFIFDD